MSNHIWTLWIEGINDYKSAYGKFLFKTSQSIMNASRINVFFSETSKRLSLFKSGFKNDFLKLRNSDQFVKNIR